MKEISDLVSVYQTAYEVAARNDSTIPTEVFVEYLPPDREEVVEPVLAAKALPVQLKACYHWKFSLCDLRRRTLRGQGANKNVLTNIAAKALMISTIENGPSFHP